MDFIIGGAFQGKKEYVKSHYNITEKDIFEGGTELYSKVKNGHWRGIKAIADFHLLVQRWIKSGDSIQTMTEIILEENPDIIIISNEVGCGIVPMEKEEREWREKTGRICCYLAKTANQVIRIQCGIGTIIKKNS